MNAEEFNKKHKIGECFFYSPLPIMHRSLFKKISVTISFAWDTQHGQTLIKIRGHKNPIPINLLKRIPNGKR